MGDLVLLSQYPVSFAPPLSLSNVTANGPLVVNTMITRTNLKYKVAKRVVKKLYCRPAYFRTQRIAESEISEGIGIRNLKKKKKHGFSKYASFATCLKTNRGMMQNII
jgi:hypothetical protein